MNYGIDDEFLLTGDTLSVESVGRTELQFGEAEAAHGAALLNDTLHEKILDLPDHTTVLPGHVSVSSDGRYEHGVAGQPDYGPIGILSEKTSTCCDSIERRSSIGAPSTSPRSRRTTRTLSR